MGKKGWIDLHCHVIPGVDDGPRDEAQALEMCRMAAGEGIRTLVAMPHHLNGLYSNEASRILVEVERFGEVVRDSGLDIEIIPGSDVHVHPDLLKMIRAHEVMTINDNGTVVMLEFPDYFPPEVLLKFIKGLDEEGIIGVISHPERCAQFEDLTLLKEMTEAGAVAQVTAMSLTGGFGRTVQKRARTMVKKGLVKVIASDAHSPDGRPPILSDAVGMAAALVGEEQALRMVKENPMALIEGKRPG